MRDDINRLESEKLRILPVIEKQGGKQSKSQWTPNHNRLPEDTQTSQKGGQVA